MRLRIFMIVLLWPALAVAQDIQVHLGQAVAEALIPYVVLIGGAVASWAIAWIALRVKKLTGVQIEQKYQEDLHRAAMTGLTAFLSKIQATASTMTIETKNQAIAAGVNWILESVPDAVTKLGITPEIAKKLVESKLGTLQEASVVLPAGPVQ